MPRPVLYDMEVPALAQAASQLAGEFDVRPLPQPAADPSPAAIVLVDGTSRRKPEATQRIIALVDPGDPGPWPDDWYAVLPMGIPTATLTRTVRNAFVNLDAVADIARLERELTELNAVGIGLSAERDTHALLALILLKAREITNSDAGSLYLVEEADGQRRLRFALTQNHSMNVPFQTATLPLTRESVAGYVAIEGRVLNLPDAYAVPPDAPFRINRSYDDQTGYRTKSMLVVPMRTPPGDTIGVLQLINCKPAFDVRLRSREWIDQLVQPFGVGYEKLASSLASQAAVALDNSRLYQSIRELFEGFVQASVTAIEARDPTTSGHSFRVAEMTVGLAKVVDSHERGLFGDLHFTADEIKELRYASLLHDFGKVGVREHVLVKAKKLYPEGLDRIRQRIELIRRSLELGYTSRKLEHLLAYGRERYDRDVPGLDAALAAELDELTRALDGIVAANEPSVLPKAATAAIQELAARAFDDHRGGQHLVLTPDEARALSVAKGSLTPDEYREIQMHVVHTFNFLSQIPWTREFHRIPEIARAHHEKLNGSGYPYGMRGDEVPVQSRMMAISDIYDALTAADRPYKLAVPIDRALDILREEQRAGSIDGDLLHLFIDAKVYELTRKL